MPAISWYAYNFPNRRADIQLVEIALRFTADDHFDPDIYTTRVRNTLVNSRILEIDEDFPEQALPGDQMGGYTSLLVQTALLFQQKAGHRVSFHSVRCFSDQNRAVALLEHDHCDVGLTAVKLACEVVNNQRNLLREPFRAFRQFAHERLLPRDTEAIIRAARRCDIPSIRLERLPYKREDFNELTGGECIRRNGLLMLGHGKYQHVLDGTFCLDLSKQYNDLRIDSDRRRRLLKKLGLRQARPGVSMTTAEQYHLVAVNGGVSAVVRQSDGVIFPSGVLDDSIIDHAIKINSEIGFAPVVVTILLPDMSASTAQQHYCVVDFELAPELDRYFERSQDRAVELLNATADMIVDWLFHGNEQTRMPIVAVTGTNGKTTTTRMINHIFMRSGLNPGMVCTEGVYLNGQQVVEGDMGTVGGHLRVLTEKEVNVAVLETHHGGMLRNGFAFHWCDVGICLNVTEDHLGRFDIDTIEQMAELKQSLLQRTRHAAVLNADNRFCLAMADATAAEKICLVSMRKSIDELVAITGSKSSCFCVLESIDNSEWLVIYDRGRRLPVMAVMSIPVTFNGTARFNTSNAMHAVLAAYLMGTGIEDIKAAMAEFRADFETTPGRLNIFENLPFRVIMDYAHNPDGLLNLCEFIDQQDADGRKVIAFAGSPDRTDAQIRNMARSVAGHFDFYFCKEYTPDGRNYRPTTHILKMALLECGVAEDLIVETTYGEEVIFEILDSCKPGDLLVMAMGNVEKFQLAGFIDEYIKVRGL